MKSLVVKSNKLPEIKDGIIKGLEIASGAKSSATFYHKREDQIAAVKNAVSNLYNISKELPLLLANQKGATGFFVQEVVLNELKKTSLGGVCNIVDEEDWSTNGVCMKALVKALHNLDGDSGITYVLRLFAQFRSERINNERARRIALSYIWGHPNIEFVFLKYRNKIKKILTHIYGQKMMSVLGEISTTYVEKNVFKNDKSNEIVTNKIFIYTGEDTKRVCKLFLFLVGKQKEKYYDSTTPLIVDYFKAKKNVIGIKNVPEEVLTGLLSNRKHPQYMTHWSSKELRESTLKEIRNKTVATSVNQQMRQTKKNEELGVTKKVNVEAVTDFLALYKTGYENGFTNDIANQIDELAKRKKINNFPYSNIGIVIDNSLSMFGDANESRNTPRAVSDFTAKVIALSAKNSVIEKTEKEGSDIATSFVSIIEKLEAASYDSYDAIFIFSDGYENSYDGLLNEVILAWKVLTKEELPIYHISPIVGAEVGAKVRSLGSELTAIAINKPEALLMQMNSKLLEADTKAWLKREFLELAK